MGFAVSTPTCASSHSRRLMSLLVWKVNCFPHKCSKKIVTIYMHTYNKMSVWKGTYNVRCASWYWKVNAHCLGIGRLHCIRHAVHLVTRMYISWPGCTLAHLLGFLQPFTLCDFVHFSNCRILPTFHIMVLCPVAFCRIPHTTCASSRVRGRGSERFVSDGQTSWFLNIRTCLFRNV